MALVPKKYSHESLSLIEGLLGGLGTGITKIAEGVKNTLLKPWKSDAIGKPKSLLDVTKQARVEPITLMDQRLAGDENVTQVLQGLLSFFAATYLQAISLITPVGRIRPRQLLDRINPERSMDSHLKDFFDEDYLGHESLNRASVPQITPYSLSHLGFYKPSLEKNLQVEPGTVNDLKAKGQEPINLQQGASGLAAKQDLYSSVNLSIGRIVDVTLSDGKVEKTIPISFRLLTAVAQPFVVAHILGDQSVPMTAKETWHNWRSKGGGFKNFWKDVVMADDLVKSHRRTLLKDSSGVYSDILERRRNNLLQSFAKGSKSLATASNLVVISKQTATELENKIGAKLDNFKARERIFASSYVMVLVVVDSAWNRCTYYHNGIKTPTTLSFNELKAANKGSGMDIEQILKAVQLGQNVSI